MRSTSQGLGGTEIELVSRKIESFSAFASIHSMYQVFYHTRPKGSLGKNLGFSYIRTVSSGPPPNVRRLCAVHKAARLYHRGKRTLESHIII